MNPLSSSLTPPISRSPSVSICTHSCTFIGIGIGSHVSVGARICSRSVLGGMGVVWGGLEAVEVWEVGGGTFRGSQLHPRGRGGGGGLVLPKSGSIRFFQEFYEPGT
jgi:hypothetical protein